MTNPVARRHTALHEAGHAVAYVIFGIPLEYASIRPGRTFRGVAVSAHHDRVGADGFDPGRTVSEQPPELRADVEREIVATLAGELAALYLAVPLTSGFMSDDSEEIAAAALASLGPRVAELVVHHEESEEPTDSDETSAHDLAGAFAGPEAGIFYLAWLRDEARGLVIRYRHAIVRVADALERHAVLRGDHIAALVTNRTHEGDMP